MSAPRPTRWLGRAALGCAVAGSLVALVAWSSVDADLILALVAVVVLGVAGVLGLVHLIISVTRRTVPTLTIIGAVVVVITGILVSAGIPFSVRWSASESAFTTYGASLPSTVGDGSTGVFPGACPTRLGLFRIDGCYQAYSTYFLYDRTGSFLGQTGFALRPPGADLKLDDGEQHYTFEHLSGDWYSFDQSYD